MKKLILLFFILLSTMFSCSKNDEIKQCINFVTTGLETVELIPTADMSGAIYKVDFPISNGCGKFDKFEEIINGNTRIIKVIIKYEGCICTQDFFTQSANYVFTTSIPGTYILKFQKTDGSFITETVVIE